MTTIDTWLAIWAALTAVWIVLLWMTWRRPTARRTVRTMALTMAVLCGVAAAMQPDVFSDDVTRYRWDGWVMTHGIDPYAFPPNDAALRHLAHVDSSSGTAYPDTVSFAHIRTIYPPLANYLSGGIALLAGTHAMRWKIAWLCVIAVLAALVMHALQHDRWRSTLFALALASPVVMMQGILDVHYDMVMALLVVLSVIAWRRGSFVVAGIVLACAVSIKYVALIALPYMLVTLTWRERMHLCSAWFLAMIAVMAPVASPQMFEAMSSFMAKWQTNSLLYTAIIDVVPEPAIRRVLLVLAAIGIGLVWWRHRHHAPTAIALSLIAFFIASPVVHAWYILTPMLLLPFAPLRSVMVWGATMIVYGFAVRTYKGDGVWSEHTVALAIEFIPVMAAWAIDMWKGPLTASRPDA